MAVKQETAVKKVRKPAAPKNAAPRKTAVSVAKTGETPAETRKAEGIIIMTKTAEEVKTAAETATEKAKGLFADFQVRAGQAAEKGKKLAVEAAEYNKANVEAAIEAAKIAAKGAQELGQTNFGYAKANFEEMQAAVKELTTVKNPADFVKVQGELARKGFDTLVAQGSKNTETMVKLVSDIFQPISNRIALSAELFKKAA